MSGMEPGRRRIEEREAQYIWVGTRILLGSGVEWEVEEADRSRRPNYLWLTIRRPALAHQNLRWRAYRILVERTDLIRCRVEDEDR